MLSRIPTGQHHLCSTTAKACGPLADGHAFGVSSPGSRCLAQCPESMAPVAPNPIYSTSALEELAP